MLLLSLIKYPDKSNLRGEHLFQIIVQNYSPSLWDCGVQLWDSRSAVVERWHGEGGSPVVGSWGQLVSSVRRTARTVHVLACS